LRGPTEGGLEEGHGENRVEDEARRRRERVGKTLDLLLEYTEATVWDSERQRRQ
jgi:hypothetical protein